MELRYNEVSSSAPRAGAGSGAATKVARLISHQAMLEQVRRGAIPESEWRQALRAICEDARADDVQPERLLVELKQALGVLCDTCLVPQGPARMEFTSRVVTLCIEEYYAERGGRHGGVHLSGGER